MAQVSRPRSLSVLTLGLPLILGLAALAGAFHLGAWPVRGETRELPTVVTELEIGGHCRLISPSCSDLTPVISVWFVGDGSITIAQDMPLHAVDSADADVLLETVVLVSTPPPRAA